MQIVEIHIDGFGMFADKHISGLSSGVNVIYGPNEFGKTTLLAFIRRILFGFPRQQASTNPYPALSGGAYGGKLVCRMDNDDTVEISRTTGMHGGQVKIQIDSTELNGQSELDRLLGHVSRDFYKNVYAISLTELQSIVTLDAEEIRNRIYGAGLELGDVSLIDIKKTFSGVSDSLYRPRGSAQVMPQIYSRIKKLRRDIREIQQGLSEYDSILEAREELLEKVGHLEEKISELEASRISLGHKKRLYPNYLSLVEAQSEFSALEDHPDISEDSIDNLKQLNLDLVGIRQRIEEAEDELTVLRTKRDSISYNEEIFDMESSINSLQRNSEKYLSASRDFDSVGVEREELGRKIKTEIAKLKGKWGEDLVREFEFRHDQRDKLRTLKDRLAEGNRKIDGATSKLELYREQRASESVNWFSGPRFYKYVIYCISVLGLLCVIGGSILQQWLLVGISSIFTVLAGYTAWRIRQSPMAEAKDPLEKRFQLSVDESLAAYQKIEEELRSFLRDINLDENLTPEGTVEVVTAIENIKSELSILKEKDHRIERMKSTVDKVEALHDKVAAIFDPSSISDNTGANIDLFVQFLQDAKDSKVAREGLEEQIIELETKLKTLNKNRDAKEKEIQTYISSVGADSEEDLQKKYREYQKRKESSSKINEIQRLIQSTVGAGKFYDTFIDEIAKTNPEELEIKLNEIEQSLEEKKEILNENNQSIGEINNKIQMLSSSEDLLIKQSEFEILKQQLNDHARIWTKAQIALLILNQAISKYEDTRQPQVIKTASGIFSRITDGRYPVIVKLAESNDLQIRDNHSRSRSVLEMSRGTKEELYFAMRLGLIQEYEKRAESLPVIMDDVLVNFDDDRGPSAIEIIKEFAADRQLIVFTCHNTALATYQEHDVNEVTFS